MTSSMKDPGSAGGMSAAAVEWADFRVTQRAALAALVAGDPQPYQGLWARTPQVSLLGAFGGAAVGWTQVRDRLAAVAEAYEGGAYECFEYLVEEVDDEQAHTVHLEAIRCRAATGEEVVRRRRVTKVYRRGVQGWRIVHMHADPLVTTAFPAGAP